MKYIKLRDVNLTSVPAEHLASLASSVTGTVDITNVSGCNLVTILDSVKSRALSISSQRLGSEETQALMRAMESRVWMVQLTGGVKLKIRDLMEYNGQGRCRVVKCFNCQGKCRNVQCSNNTAARYRDQLRTWATSRNWRVDCDDNSIFLMNGYNLLLDGI